jgi:hypothetical protein
MGIKLFNQSVATLRISNGVLAVLSGISGEFDAFCATRIASLNR